MTDTPNDMSIEQLTQAVHVLKIQIAQLQDQNKWMQECIKVIESLMPDWLKNGDMYPPSLLRTLGIPTAFDSFGNILTYPTNHVVNSQNQPKGKQDDY